MSWPNHGYTGAVLPRPSIRSIRPLDRCCSIAYSSAMRTGSLVVISVVDVVTISRLVVAAMYASSVVGADEKNGGLWCSPIANTSSPTSSVFCAIAHDRVDPLRLARRLPRHRIPGDVTDREDPELHDLPPTLPACPRSSARAPIDICVCMYLNTESAGLFRGTAGAAATMARWHAGAAGSRGSAR